MITYQELESLKYSWKGEVCIFGAGKYGIGEGYEFVKAAEFSIDFYCDNFVAPGTHARDGLVVRDIQYLYAHRENVFVFVCVSAKYKKEIVEQLKSHGVNHIVLVENNCIMQIMEEIDKLDDVVRKRWHYFYDDVEFLTRVFKRRVGYDLDLEHPKTFNAKLQWLKLYDRNPAYTQMVDKFEAKKYVVEKIGEEYIVPTMGVFDSFEKINFEKLPKQFVLKCTHDSGSIVICRDKDDFDQNKAREILNRGMQRNFYWVCREWPYKNVKPRIIAEKYMDLSSELTDYKFMCFHGEPKMIFTCTERFDGDGLKVTFFDLDWNKLDFERHYPASSKKIEKPKNLELMLDISRKLCKGIPFVRVDLYEIMGRVYFGEMTFSPGAGMEEFRPVEWDYIMGEWIAI